MCTTCGCDAANEFSISTVKPIAETQPATTGMHSHTNANGHSHWHSHEHGHEHHHHGEILETIGRNTRLLKLETDVLSQNNLLAQQNRVFFEGSNIFVLNLVSSPGSGKTTLLEQTLQKLYPSISCAVIEGDQQTQHDAERIAITGAPVVQINTGKGCHLDAAMIAAALPQLPLQKKAILFIENVGNLVCPALFDLGEQKRVVISSVTEGDDKPLKYPDMFRSAHLCIINKTDLLPYVPFEVDRFIANALTINHHLTFIALSALKQDGMTTWYQWLMDHAVQQNTTANTSVLHAHHS